MFGFKEMPNGRGYGIDIEGEEAKRALQKLGLGNTPEGGYEPGTTVKKVNSKEGDAVKDGTIGIVKGGIDTKLEIDGEKSTAGYIVKWDDPTLPKEAVNFVVNTKLEKVEG